MTWFSSLLTLISVGWASAALGYEVFGADWTHLSSPREVRFVVCTEGKGIPVGASATIRAAADLWSTNAIRIRFDPDRCLAEYPRVDNINTIRFAAINPGPQTDGHDNAYAYRRNDLRRMQECDIVFNIARHWHAGNGSPEPKQHDLLSVALHEFGHCLGLEHSAITNAVMSAALPAGRTRRALQADDIAGRRKLYGQ
ncbi:matrixin family metalloprotease [Pseudoroseomonas ludipueritiae]|uniref:Matrixin family metalloprotease n=1 Tax=Pseudoroseomonas ludipueritiae TaxID=198093 RepID=A0ABR7R309_9PROT|nr:matrixin family metalloprotease [Pseudoroseomonas ludipueritiae]MBC9176139.1 matrixin family metalloprotease [Pseudoroseomonas ludipueritiae]